MERTIIPLTIPDCAFKGQRVHFIGIGGCGMRGLAALLIREGAVVTGSDRAASPETEYLETIGIGVAIGQRPENVAGKIDRVIISAAIKEENPELRAARERGLPVVKYARLLGEVMACRYGIAVSGTHGKTTTTALLSYILFLGGLDPSFVIGGDVPQLGGGSRAGGGQHFVAEACEYDHSFLNLRPRIAAILNVEHDHPDCYPDLESVIEVFASFASLVPADGKLIVNGEDRNVPRVIGDRRTNVETFGIDGEGLDWRAEDVRSYRGRSRFELWYRDRRLGVAQMKLTGRHNVMNGLAAAAMAWHAGADVDTILRAMATFAGVGRRMELKGISRGIAVVDDYAHHPTEIQASLRAIRDTYEPERLWVVFQPHQHSRTRFLMADFARSFALADVTLVPEIYFVRDSEAEKQAVSSKDLVSEIRRSGGNAEYLGTFEEIVARLSAELRPGDCLVTMGAGSVYEIADQMLSRLSEAAGAAGK
jgi:UDP-N-acetylmuramate--alanine ligase